MQKILSILFLLFVLNSIRGQGFDMKDFSRKTETVKWILDYDSVAWFSTDTLLTREQQKLDKLGREWFCFQDSDDTWHSVYGKYENGKYEQIFHFIVKSQTEVTETHEQIDTTFLNRHGKALARAFKEIDPIVEGTPVNFNHYIKENEKGNFNVYILPAFGPDRIAFYGIEFNYEISPEDRIKKDKSYVKDEILGYKTDDPKEIWLDYTDIKQPTLGSIFFCRYYQNSFDKIYIENKTSFTTLLKGSEGFHWTTILKDPKEESKKKREKRRKARKGKEQK